MEKIVSYAKAHPWIAGGVVLGVGIILVLLFSGGSQTEEVDNGAAGYSPYPSVDQAANAMLVQSQLSAQVASKQLDNGLAAEKDANATAAAVARMNFDYLQNKDVIAGKVSVRAIEGQEYVAARAAEVELAGINQAANVANNATNAAREVQLLGINRAAEVSSLQIKKAWELGVHQANVERLNATDLANTQRYVAGLAANTEREKNQLAAQTAANNNAAASTLAQQQMQLDLYKYNTGRADSAASAYVATQLRLMGK